MATELDHVGLANRNDLALRHLMEKPDELSEWIATVAFYKAVHVVEAMFDAQSVGTTTSHEERRDKLKSENRFQFVYSH